jgi:hypothetical protein
LTSDLKNVIQIIFLISAISGVAQNDNTFIIDNYYIPQNLLIAVKRDTIAANRFEDKNFIIESSCSGEFGGSLLFTDKKKSKKYECTSVCCRTINKIGDSYIVTNSLAHMMGSTNIMEIRNPRHLKLYNEREEKLVKYIGEDESTSTQGTNNLLDSIGILTVLSFPYKDKLYHLIDDGSIKIAEIKNRKFRVIVTVLKDDINPYFGAVYKNDLDHMILEFDVPKNNGTEIIHRKGCFDIFENHIKVYWIN